jgi:hypothetical protein
MREAKAPHENTKETRTIKVGPEHMREAKAHLRMPK